VTSEEWDRRSERPLLVVSVIFLVLLCLPVIQPDLGASARQAVTAADVGIWLIFAIAYLVGLRLADDRRRYFRTHVLDLLVVALPAFRPLRLLRLLTLGGLLQQRGAAVALGDVTRVVGVAGVLVAFLGAVGVVDAERGAKGANIGTFGDAVWWACTTITTVGYGDRYPVTTRGRVIAVAVMLVGIALLGLLTAGIASSFVRRFSREPEIEAGIRVEAAELADVRERLAAIEAALGRLSP
jgi:voltage-gated potassium channel